MSRTVIDVDDEAMAEVGESGKWRMRAVAVARMREMVAAGEIDFSVVEERHA
ncbi:hypothetical protein AB0392_20795 [Nonomuraea angiospora]|uniref:hypothetical protein n=1 Tax=Nonomuraea angiospora TaxID=46172 RepID=UPI00345100DE